MSDPFVYALPGEADFFLFLALAVVLNASEAILTAERSQLPEVLTALGVASRPELAATGSLAEELRRQTPCPFSGRVRRRVLKPERQDSLEELEREGVFYIVKEELVGAWAEGRAERRASYSGIGSICNSSCICRVYDI